MVGPSVVLYKSSNLNCLVLRYGGIEGKMRKEWEKYSVMTVTYHVVMVHGCTGYTVVPLHPWWTDQCRWVNMDVIIFSILFQPCYVTFW